MVFLCGLLVLLSFIAAPYVIHEILGYQSRKAVRRRLAQVGKGMRARLKVCGFNREAYKNLDILGSRVVQLVIMYRRLIAALVILGWVSLSGFDVVEDLDHAPGQPQLSKTSTDSVPGSKRVMGPLANNMIESASRTKPIRFVPLELDRQIFRVEPLREFRKHSQIHKLFRVFLI